ncbi:MAG TPA: helix-turn-helix domain-containing protein [Anaerolineales bacterium]|nr:helix-turn-helix domain-containing protein [Anaerolineales bacterium]
MTQDEVRTRERILLAALALFGERGIAASSMNQIAERAGITRVTVYRHFVDKERLTLEAFLLPEKMFMRGLAELKRNLDADWQEVLNKIGEGLSALPSADVFARAEELKRIYPAAYAKVQEVRVETLNGLFQNLFAGARRQKALRPGLNRRLFQAIFWELAINIFDNPRFRSLGLTDEQLFRGLTDILLHGIIQES